MLPGVVLLGRKGAQPWISLYKEKFLLSNGAANLPSAEESQLCCRPPLLQYHSHVLHSKVHATAKLCPGGT